ncbi:MAG TPA: Fe-S-containing protein [Coriobacteriia bacterium]
MTRKRKSAASNAAPRPVAKPGSKPASKPASKSASKPAPPKGNRKMVWIVAGAALLLVIGVASLSGKGWGTGGATSGISPDEAKYMGRFLPAGYQEPKLADVAVYTSPVTMTDITATDDGTKLSVPVGDVTTNKIVKFEYARPGARAIPLLAYVKPSGKLFVAVSFCPPCEGEGQRIEPDGTLVCASCGTKRDLEQGVGLSGACKLYPLDELPVTVAADRISVDKAILDGWTAQPKDRPIGG